jgi:hypothetical protein
MDANEYNRLCGSARDRALALRRASINAVLDALARAVRRLLFPGSQRKEKPCPSSTSSSQQQARPTPRTASPNA